MLFTDIDYSRLLRPTCQGQWEVGISLQTERDKFPIRLISREHSEHKGICKGLCFAWWQIIPEFSQGKLCSPQWAPAWICAQRAAWEGAVDILPPALLLPASPQAGSLAGSSQNSRNNMTCLTTLLSRVC